MSTREIPDQTPFSKLPKLPEGWHYEQHSGYPEVVHIVWPSNGAMSVDFKQRTLAGGWCRPAAPGRSETLREGRGWKEKLIGDAVARFQAIFEATRAL